MCPGSSLCQGLHTDLHIVCLVPGPSLRAHLEVRPLYEQETVEAMETACLWSCSQATHTHRTLDSQKSQGGA